MGSTVHTVTPGMRTALLSLLLTSVAARPDGPGGHHHHHPHHAAHGDHQHQHGTHQVGGVINVEPVHHAAHNHHQEPVHVVHSVHSVEPVQSHHSSHSSVSNSVVSTPVDTKSSDQTVADLLTTNPKFSTLLTAVQAAGLMETLRQPGPMTVFAPTNIAFDKVPVDDLNNLLQNKEELKKVLLRHVVPGTNMQGKNFPPGTVNLQTAAGEEITATRDKFIQLQSRAGTAYIVLFDIHASNAVIH